MSSAPPVAQAAALRERLVRMEAKLRSPKVWAQLNDKGRYLAMCCLRAARKDVE